MLRDGASRQVGSPPGPSPLVERASRSLRELFAAHLTPSRLRAVGGSVAHREERRLDEMGHLSVLAGHFLALKRGGSLLDVGCGDGILQEWLTDGAYSRYVGVDKDDVIEHSLHRGDERTMFVRADMNAFVPPQRFDAVVFCESLYYLHDTIGGLRRYQRYLADDGVFLVSMWASEKNSARWRDISVWFDVLDETQVTNAAGTRWTCKAFVPKHRDSSADGGPHAG